MIKVAIYARVSTKDREQNPETQLYALRQFCQDAGWEIYQEYVDQAKAKDYAKRTAWLQLQKDARQRRFKIVLVFRLDRAFRSVRECVNLVEDWFERGIAFKSVGEDVIDTTTAQGKFILQIMAAIAELESAIIGERVAAGMARAKAENKPIGRKPLALSLERICQALQDNPNITRAAAANDGSPRTRSTASRNFVAVTRPNFTRTPAPAATTCSATTGWSSLIGATTSGNPWASVSHTVLCPP